MRSKTYRRHQTKMRQAARKLERTTKRFRKDLMEVNQVMNELPLQVRTTYNLDKDFFGYLPKVQKASESLRGLQGLNQKIEKRDAASVANSKKAREATCEQYKNNQH